MDRGDDPLLHLIRTHRFKMYDPPTAPENTALDSVEKWKDSEPSRVEIEEDFENANERRRVRRLLEGRRSRKLPHGPEARGEVGDSISVSGEMREGGTLRWRVRRRWLKSHAVFPFVGLKEALFEALADAAGFLSVWPRIEPRDEGRPK